jgi:hypothetical protein
MNVYPYCNIEEAKEISSLIRRFEVKKNPFYRAYVLPLPTVEND